MKRNLVLWILGVVAVLALWLVVGVLPRLFTSGMEEAGQFGDMFGTVNSLFSGIALIGVVVAIYLQMREIKENSAAQRKQQTIQTEQIRLQTEQTSIAQRTARIQALTFLASFQYQMMQNAPQAQRDDMLKRIVRLNDRAIDLLVELGEDFSGDSEAAGRGVKIPTDKEKAFAALKGILDHLQNSLESEGREASLDNTKVNNALDKTAKDLQKWSEDHRDLVDVAPIIPCLTKLNKPKKHYPKERTSPKDWATYWKEVDEIVDSLTKAIGEIEQK